MNICESSHFLRDRITSHCGIPDSSHEDDCLTVNARIVITTSPPVHAHKPYIIPSLNVRYTHRRK